MASSPPRGRLTPLQHELLEAFFARDQRLFLTGGAALGGFHLEHRTTKDLDLFGFAGTDLDSAERTFGDAAASCGATLESLERHGDFRRLRASRGEESCLVELVVDRAPPLEREKLREGTVRLDSLREIMANKICTLLGRTEPKDLVDVKELLARGLDLRQALIDAETKDGAADAATLAWLLEDLRITADSGVPRGYDPVELDRFRADLAKQFRAIAFEHARKT